MTQQQGADALVLRLERLIRAGRERVWAAWTEAEQLRRWSAPEGLHVAEGTLDLRPGGSWSVVMVEPDGTRHEAFGTYLEVTPPSRLVYTHAWRRGGGSTPETTVTVDFDTVASGTVVTLTQHGFAAAASRDGHGEGWASTLDSLEKLFERQGGEAVSVLRHQADLTRNVVRINLAGVSHEESLQQPQPAGNCINWVLGHLVAVHDGALRLLDQEPVLQADVAARYARGSQPVTDADEAQPLEELARAWETACDRLEAGLARLTAERLRQPAAFSPSGNAGETVQSLLSTILFHQAYHGGQLGVLRRLVGKPGAIS